MGIRSLADFLGTTSTAKDAAAPESLAQATDPVDYDKLTAAEFCKAILTSPEYRQSIVHRITLGTLPPAVECRFYDYAYGKPVEKVEVKDTTDDSDDLTAEQLEERAAHLMELARELRDINADDDDDAGDSRLVH